MVLGDFFSGTAIFVVVLLIVAIWIIIEIKRFRHKIFAIFLIISILFFYIGTISILNENEIDLTTISGIVTAGKIYFSWFVSIFVNLKVLTSNAINLDWSQNFTTANNNI